MDTQAAITICPTPLLLLFHLDPGASRLISLHLQGHLKYLQRIRWLWAIGGITHGASLPAGRIRPPEWLPASLGRLRKVMDCTAWEFTVSLPSGTAPAYPVYLRGLRFLESQAGLGSHCCTSIFNYNGPMVPEQI